jgi:hypothetical protein
MTDRYYVDARVGVIAVIDRHALTGRETGCVPSKAAVRQWHGYKDADGYWRLPLDQPERAEDFCSDLNMWETL